MKSCPCQRLSSFSAREKSITTGKTGQVFLGTQVLIGIRSYQGRKMKAVSDHAHARLFCNRWRSWDKKVRTRFVARAAASVSLRYLKSGESRFSWQNIILESSPGFFVDQSE
jgi:hypothetical protein